MTARSILSLLPIPLGLGASLYYYDQTSPARNATYTTVATPGHVDSFPMSLVNPQGFPTHQGTYSLRIPIRELTPNITDEEVLARFIQGFFSRWAMTPERWLLCAARKSWTDLSGLHLSPTESATKSEKPIWKLSSLNPNAWPLPLGTYIFGMFLLVDCSGVSEAERQRFASATRDFPRSRVVFAEFAGGSDRSNLAYTHRFEVRRQLAQDGEQEREASVDISFSSVVVDPLDGRPLPGPVAWFHVVYSKFLFADGIREVLRH
ncbi:hypothetical protein ASPBRDRAFT_201195 [Aspergillus brasiliensis CBS 101740]|uniref:Uncharacterized protein n=1 Tax=Aspergillus brasiliensis (strain CBS 101740 / IMI 381727 / IBT 21946) TaxID=767769 RepID=A0A1L9U325_ASPBC|nr:hypothetical protein ASPBRDRAFT_201195 [Aspergillus brasiliensis CBS 101740]